MKKAVSIFILCSIFLTSFFNQEAIASGYRSLSSGNAIHTHSSGHHFYKNAVISEVSSEVEDSENKLSPDFQVPDFRLFIFSFYHIKNQLKKFYFSSENKVQVQDLPIFLINRSIQI